MSTADAIRAEIKSYRVKYELDELRRDLARGDFLQFVKYTKPDYITGWFHQVLAKAQMRFMKKVERCESPRQMLWVPAQHGKALALDTPIPTPNGWTTMGDLRPGDYVFDDQGKPTRVVAVSDVWKNRTVYRVTGDDGDSVIADAEHEWPVRLCVKHKNVANKTSAYLAARKSKRKPMLAAAGAIECARADLPIPPYTLGVWLGDGSNYHATVSKPAADCTHMRARIEAEGVTTSDRATADTFGLIGILTPLKVCGLLVNKHIPAAYLRASADQRLALLQGLVDTDGHVAPDGQVEFCSTDEALAQGFHELIRSLGTKASMVEGRAILNGRDYGPKYRVMFYRGDAASLPRKRARCRWPKKTGRYLDVVPAGRADTVCIEVEAPSHLFLCGRGMMPTHNSEQVSRRFPPWVFGHHPNWHIISASYNSKLARRFGRDVRDIMSSPRYRNIFPETIIGGRVAGNAGSKAADELSLTKGGSYLAVGLGGTAVGLPANIFNIDDPVKGSEEADSEVKQEGALDWYLGTAATRLQKGGGVLITQTRWGDDDLSGQLVEIMERDPNADQWEIIVFPAIATEDEHDPETKKLRRKAGEALCPELHPLHELERTRATFIAAGRTRDWSAIYQQNPTPADGVFYKATDFRTVRRAPKTVNTYITTDLALGQKTANDWTVLLPGGVDVDDSLVILPQAMRKRMDALETACRLLLMADEIDAQVITLPNDHMGKTLKPFLEKLMDGAEDDDAVVIGEQEFEIPRRYYTIEMMPVIGDKVARSAAIQARQRQGKVFWTEGVFFNEIARPEMLKFPHGSNDDVCDAFADLGRLLEQMDRARKPKAKPRTHKPPSRWAEVESRERSSRATPIPSLFGDDE